MAASSGPPVAVNFGIGTREMAAAGIDVCMVWV
jgi:hypothetical protein